MISDGIILSFPLVCSSFFLARINLHCIYFIVFGEIWPLPLVAAFPFCSLYDRNAMLWCGFK